MLKSSRSFKQASPLIVLSMIFALPVLAAGLIYIYADSLALKGGNRGIFLSSPVSYAQLGIIDRTTDVAEGDLIHHRWTLVYFYSGRCFAACQKDLQELEQIRMALGKNYGRTGLLALTPQHKQNQPRLRQQTKHVSISTGTLSYRAMIRLAELTGKGDFTNQAQLFLADNRGNLIMYYPMPINQQSVYDDLRWLLKANSG